MVDNDVPYAAPIYPNFLIKITDAITLMTAINTNTTDRDILFIFASSIVLHTLCISGIVTGNSRINDILYAGKYVSPTHRLIKSCPNNIKPDSTAPANIS